jgi:hypothetical protein
LGFVVDVTTLGSEIFQSLLGGDCGVVSSTLGCDAGTSLCVMCCGEIICTGICVGEIIGAATGMWGVCINVGNEAEFWLDRVVVGICGNG